MKVWMITDEHGEIVRFEEAPELELASLHEGHTARVVHLPSAASPILLVRPLLPALPAPLLDVRRPDEARLAMPPIHRGASVSRCPSGKIRYRDRVAALTALSEVTVKRGRQKQRSRLDERRAYRCQRCFGWHLTSYPDDMDAPGEGALA